MTSAVFSSIKSGGIDGGASQSAPASAPLAEWGEEGRREGLHQRVIEDRGEETVYNQPSYQNIVI